MDPGFFYETVAPLLLIGNTSLIAISTLTSEINFYTRLLRMRDKTTGLPLFTSISVQLACRYATAVYRVDWHGDVCDGSQEMHRGRQGGGVHPHAPPGAALAELGSPREAEDDYAGSTRSDRERAVRPGVRLEPAGPPEAHNISRKNPSHCRRRARRSSRRPTSRPCSTSRRPSPS